MQEYLDSFMSPLRMAAWTHGLIAFSLLLSFEELAGDDAAYSIGQRRHDSLRMSQHGCAEARDQRGHLVGGYPHDDQHGLLLCPVNPTSL